MPHRLVNIAPMLSADGGDLLLGAIVGAKHLEEEAAGVGGEICREDRTGDEARDGDQEDAGEPSQATWHASMLPADLMGHKSVAPASEGSVERASPGEELRCRPAYAAGGGLDDDEVLEQHAERLGLQRVRMDGQEVIAEEALLRVTIRSATAWRFTAPRLAR